MTLSENIRPPKKVDKPFRSTEKYKFQNFNK